MQKTAAEIGTNKQLDIANVGAFLDCILDICYVDTLKINIPYEGFESYSRLFSIISHRCPKLRCLSITFYSIRKLSLKHITSRLAYSDLSQVDHRLTCLEKLDLHHGTDVIPSDCSICVRLPFANKSKTSILSIVGEYCPILTSLNVEGFYIRNEDMLALIIGASANILFPINDDQWTNDAVIKSLLVPTELMTPLSFTLRHLELTSLCCHLRCYCNPIISAPTTAFALRHFPVLSTAYIEGNFPTIITAIQLLYSNRGDDGRKTEIQKEFEEYCRHLTGIKRHRLRPPLSGKIDHGKFYNIICVINLLKQPLKTNYSGFLGLSEVNQRLLGNNADCLRSIGYMCPNLAHFVFDEEMLWKHLVPEELESILSAWPKVLLI